MAEFQDTYARLQMRRRSISSVRRCSARSCCGDTITHSVPPLKAQ